MNKICTSLDQSQKLIELGIDVNTADMIYTTFYGKVSKSLPMPKEVYDILKYPIDGDKCILAWSLSALLELIPPYLGEFNDGIDFGEVSIKHTAVVLPKDPLFWGSVVFISIFIRGFYGIVQIYAQRYINAFYTSLIFSTEIVITVFMSPVLAMVFDTKGEEITAVKLAGSLVIVAGVLISDEVIFDKIESKYKAKRLKSGKEKSNGKQESN